MNPKLKTRNSKPSRGDAESAGQSPETILLAVTGMSPAVITETVWALAHESEPILPHRVIAATTSVGREEIRRQLFEPLARFGHRTAWETLRAALAAEGFELTGRLRFGITGDDVRVLTTADPASGRSRELADIRSPTDNQAAADFLLETVRGIVENPDTRLIASLAGGRKTMGALLYACMTLAGRETDRLTHVLVNEPFENLREFFFPGQPGGPFPRSTRAAPSVASGQSAAFDPATAVVDLADVPFVPLRNLFVRELGRKAGSFHRLVEICRSGLRRRAAENLRVSLDPQRAELEVNGARFKLAPAEMLVLLFLAHRAKQNEPAFAAYKDALDDLNTFRDKQRKTQKDFTRWPQADSLRIPWDEREITRTVSDLRQKLRQQGGDASVLAACLPEKGRCSLDLPGEMIHIKS
jgi:CRISPR-associated protein (TIGR02584 family)